MIRTASFPPEEKGVIELQSFVYESLAGPCGMPPRETKKGTLVAEESALSLLKHGKGEGRLHVTVKKVMGSTSIEISALGEEYDLQQNLHSASLDEITSPKGTEHLGGEDSQSEEDGKEKDWRVMEEIGDNAQEVIQNILLRSLVDDVKYRHRNGKNSIRLILQKSKMVFFYQNMIALISALLLGLLLSRFAPEAFNQAINSHFFVPIKTMYINLFKCIVGPVVFFSIVSSISNISNLTELGKIGGKILILFLLTTTLALGVGIGCFYLIRPGQEGSAVVNRQQEREPGEETPQSTSAGNSPQEMLSFTNIIVNIVPDNIVSPFLNNDMLQLILVAVLVGMATGFLGQYSIPIKTLIDGLNEMFLVIASMILHFMPISVFSSMISMALSLGITTFLNLLGMFGTFLFGLVCMIGVYSLLLVLFAGVNPVSFFKGYAPTSLQIFSMASSNGAVPINMEYCKSQGISSQVYKLSIPLGATLNMDGMCIQLSIFALSLARMYGVPVPMKNLLLMGITIIILSLGAPGIPGAGAICLSVLLTQLHVPTEAVSIVMGIGPLLGMFLCMSNCTGDVVVTTIVDKWTKLEKKRR